MCGITGIIHPKASHALISAMTDVMYLRGPDGAGYHVDHGIAMGMRRLSIIDLEHGWQPLFSGDQSIVAFQNGEIYNHARLRSELQVRGYEFKTQSDTEVIAHGYHCWGISGLVSRLDGMYAIAILDKRQRLLHLVRDRFGEKPLFLAAFDNGIAYASDMRILAALPGVGADLSLEGVNAYLALHYVPGRQTILDKVRRVLPGERVEISLDTKDCHFERYYVPPIGATRKLNDDELAERVESAVASRLVSDVPVGVFLSGGLDSSIVASIAAKKVEGIATFSMGFHSAEHDESEFAKLLARQIGSDHHHFMFDENSFASLLPKVASALDEPIGDQALLPTYWLCHEASQHVKVVLSGEGADEIFAGYGYYSPFSAKLTLKDRIKRLLGRAQRHPVQRLIHNAVPVTPSGFPLLTDMEGRRALVGNRGEAMSAWEHKVLQWLADAADPLQRATATDLVTWLPDDLLVKFDRMAMANSLEGRAPFLDPAVVEAGTTGLMPHERMHGGISKVALRRVAKRWLPVEIQDRKKQGFVLPMRYWISNWATAQPNLVEDIAAIPCYGEVLAPLGRALAQSITSEPPRERFHFAVLMLCEWSRSFQHNVSLLQSSLAQKMN